jgi:hypothetical protein
MLRWLHGIAYRAERERRVRAEHELAASYTAIEKLEDKNTELRRQIHAERRLHEDMAAIRREREG